MPLARIDAAVRQAYRALVANYTTHTGPTNWVHFNNFAEWGTTPQDFLDRAGESEFCQICNNITAAGYWTAFTNGAGRTLNGARHTYQLTFPAGQIPRPSGSGRSPLPSAHPGTGAQPAGQVPGRQLHPGPGEEPGRLDHDHHGADQARRLPTANWLPVPRRKFVIAMRAYGPTGTPPTPTTPRQQSHPDRTPSRKEPRHTRRRGLP